MKGTTKVKSVALLGDGGEGVVGDDGMVRVGAGLVAVRGVELDAATLMVSF